MIIKVVFYYIKCDCCGKGGERSHYMDDAIGNTMNAKWKHFGGKYYCPGCWHLTAKGNIKTADGQLWDGETGKLIKRK